MNTIFKYDQFLVFNKIFFRILSAVGRLEKIRKETTKRFLNDHSLHFCSNGYTIIYSENLGNFL